MAALTPAPRPMIDWSTLFGRASRTPAISRVATWQSSIVRQDGRFDRLPALAAELVTDPAELALVRVMPQAVSCTAANDCLFDHLVGARGQWSAAR